MHLVEGQESGKWNQDRSVSLRLRPLKEGEMVAVGRDRFE